MKDEPLGKSEKLYTTDGYPLVAIVDKIFSPYDLKSR